VIRHHREVQPSLTAIVETLARAYLRLAEKRRIAALSDTENLQKPLEVCDPERPDVLGKAARGA